MASSRISLLSDRIKSICDSTAPSPVITSEGYSGAKVISLLCAAADLLPANGDEVYAEIGVYRGLTFCNVASSLVRAGKTNVPCIGIDNFSQFDQQGTNEKRVRGLIGEHHLSNVTLWNGDYEAAIRDWGAKFGNQKIGIFFIDGPHDYRSQLLCLLLALPHLSQEAIVVIDDCNYPHVRLATRDFLVMHPEYKLVFEAYTHDHPMNVPEESRLPFLEGWWDGIHVIARDGQGRLEPMYPEVGDARAVSESEHLLQSKIYRNRWLEAVPLLDATLDRRYLRMFREGRRLRELMSTALAAKHKIQTLSKDLPKERLNPSLSS